MVLAEDGQPLPGATVFVKGTFVGTSTNAGGEFVLQSSPQPLPLTLVVAYVGHVTQEVLVADAAAPVRVLLPYRTEQVSQVIMSASRIEENIQLAPVTVDKVSRADLERQATPEVLTSLARLKGLDISSASMLFTSLSTRGFNTAKSERVVQLTDYQDTQLPSLGLSPGNLLGLPELDIESVEIIHGPASALYGANALSGVILFNSRDAFVSPGLGVRLRGGQRGLLDAQARFAHKINERLAFKVTGSALRAHDWLASNYTAAATSVNPAGSSLGYDPINSYGNYGVQFTPAPNPALPAGINPELYGQTIYTPGFTEKELVAGDDHTSSFRLQGTVAYLLRPNLKLTAEARLAQATATYQNLSRFRVKDLRAQQYRAELKSNRGFVRLYTTHDAANRSYELNQLGNLLQEAPDNDGSGRSFVQTYFSTYNTEYTRQRQAGAGVEAARQAAQQAADATRLTPANPRFASLRQQIIDDSEPGRGARQRFGSSLTDLSAQYSLPVSDFGTVLTAGAAYRHYRLSSGGQLFADTTGRAITNYEYGAYGQIIQTLLHDRLKLSVAARVDEFRNFDTSLSPRAAAVYSVGPDQRHNFRASYGQAYRAPSQLEQHVYEDLGYAVFLGNVRKGYQGYRGTNDQGQAFGTTPDLSSFEVSLAPLDLERATTWEVGYRGTVLPNFYLDASYYRSEYRNFIASQILLGNLDGTRPTLQQVIAGAPTYSDRNQPTRILFTYFNSSQRLHTQGVTAALSYTGWRAVVPMVNYSFNALDRSEIPSGVATYFNTPRHKFNVGASGTVGRFGYLLNYRWAQGHYQEMPFAAGYVASFSSTDASVRYQLPKLHAVLQTGVSNAFDARNVQVIGGPQISRLAFAGVELDLP
ncbi:TonB-dependent receptor [Hymenobacter pini]|uniref:TonB-dependent receptor n=1 Tax=Hymenobacter pini TaxID=2880879 RepID=UPI001CF48AE1|nr:TonB-dependent receptor [Hymenobacter pini]MCA8831838.1 TonB-dependent receptor [Hymenobacter pini]